jgi:hypothetical protein
MNHDNSLIGDNSIFIGPKEKVEFYSYNDPFSGAVILGLLGSFSTFIGATIRSNPTHDECIVVLIGGCILGAVAGCISLFLSWIPIKTEVTKIIIAVIDNGLLFSGIICAPILGIALMNVSSPSWSIIISDEFIGISILLAPVACCSLCLYSISYCHSVIQDSFDSARVFANRAESRNYQSFESNI